MWHGIVDRLIPAVPQWASVGVEPSAQFVTAELRWESGSAEATRDHTIASLKPLTIATSIDAGPRPLLQYRDRLTECTLGALRLRKEGTIAVEDATLTVYQVESGRHYCLGWPLRELTAWRQNRNMLKHRAANHLNMEPVAAQQLMVTYLCPRPVVLVSVETEGHRNIFPMDLIGPLEGSGLFSLALRSTNVSEPTMRDVRRVALSHPPASMKAAVYQLARHHKDAVTIWNELSVPLSRSPRFDIPTVASALRVQELAIIHSQVIGSHTFFLCRVVSAEDRGEGEQLHHTAGFHQYYRQRLGLPFPEA
ncbi:flavin reductase [Luteibacter sp.]|jgi:flavin reductase (DIM6/NTAB) family NADH-FMN oxidoreductase RutF|uniref:flavin reductase n=1 Tax=Luteibacter sp. TaxID=1886636 RepID=UPI002F3E70E6